MRIFDSIPVDQLSPTAKAIAEKLDANEFAVRADPKLKGNRRLEADEVRFALQNLDAFAVEHRPVILEMARVLGVEMPASVPRKWVDRSSPDPRWTSAYLDAVSIGNFVFVSDRRYGVIRYDTAHDQWFKMAKPGFDKEYFWWQSPGIGTFQGKLAMVGTYPHQTGPAWGYARLYDPATGNVESLPNCAPRTRCAVAEHDDKLYVFGGSVFTNEQSAMLGSPIDSVQVYDRAAGKWRDLPPLPEARYGAKAIALGDKIYVVGGRGLNGSSKRIDVFDPKTEQWLDPLYMATPRLNPTAWIEDGKLHISGGMNVGPIKLHDNDPQRAGGQGEYQDVDTSTEILNPLTKTLSQGATSPFDGDEAGVIAMTNDGRKFSFSIKEVTGSYGTGQRAFEHVVPEGAKPHTVVNIVDNSTTINVDIDVLIEKLSKDITNIRIEEHNYTTLSCTHESKPFEFDVLEFCNTGNQVLASDGEFYCRLSYEQRDLIKVGCDEGRRYLMGENAGTKLPLPKEESFLLYHRESDTKIPFSTDRKGRFAVPIGNLTGEVFIVKLDEEGRSQAVAIHI